MNRRGPRLGPWTFGVLTVVVTVLGLVAAGRRLSEGTPTLGVSWVETRSGVVALSVDEGGPAARAGLLPGDRLVSAEGRPIGGLIEAEELPWLLPGDRSARLEVRRGDASFEIVVEPLDRREAPSLYGFLALVGAAFIASGAFIAIRWPAMRGALVYGFFGLALGANLVLSHTGLADAVDWTVHGVDIAAGILAPALLLQLAIVLSRRSVPARRSSIAVAYLPAIALAAGAVWLEGLGGAYRFADPAEALTDLERAQVLYLAVAVVGAVAILARSYARSASALHRGQMRWLLWGIAVGLGPFVAIYALPWALDATVPPWADLSALPVLLVPAAATAAMARYRLNDLDLVLRRGLAAAALGFVVVGTYAASLIVLRRLVDSRAMPRDVLGFLAAVIVAVAYPKIRSWVQAGVDRAFYRARYSYRATLLDWGRELNAETDLATLLDRLQDRVRETLDVPFAIVLVRAGPRRFEEVAPGSGGTFVELPKDLQDRLESAPSVSSDDSLLAPLPDVRHVFGMRVKGRLCAILAIAERSATDQPLTSEDRALLATLCSHAAAAIEAARLVREVRLHADQVESLKARQERILESSGVGLLLIDAHGRILAWNRALEEIYGMTRDEAIGRRVAEVFPLNSVRALERAAAASGPREETRLYGHGLVNRRGERIVVNVTVAPMAEDDQGGDEARVITFDDVTERKRLEDRVSRQERLASLGLLAAGVAHEVNTPLTGISSYTQMLLEDLSEDDPRRDVLEKIESQSRRASDIANSLLNLARPERASHEPIDVNAAVREVLQLFEPQLKGRAIRLDVRLDPSLPDVLGHSGKLQQVVLNLLLNARDAIDDGGRITITTRFEGERVVLEVCDDGTGIAEEDVPRIFDPFFTTKGRGKGTGLGLSISYGIVREHEGEMQVDSVPGEMTRFKIDLPPAGSARGTTEAGA